MINDFGRSIEKLTLVFIWGRFVSDPLPLKLTIMTQHFILTVLVIYGIHATTQPRMIFSKLWGMLFDFLAKRMKDPSRILKPLFDCTPCMASVYGTISFFLYGSFPEPLVLSLFVWVLSLCGFNYILNKILNS